MASERERQVGKRLRQFREEERIPRTGFALEIGISTDRLANYEAGKARLPYPVYCRVASKFPINPVWLATGDGDPIGPLPFHDPPGAENMSFLEVYQRFLSDPVHRDVYSLRQRIDDFDCALILLSGHLERRKAMSQSLPVDKNIQLKIRDIQGNIVSAMNGLEDELLRALSADASRQEDDGKSKIRRLERLIQRQNARKEALTEVVTS